MVSRASKSSSSVSSLRQDCAVVGIGIAITALSTIPVWNSPENSTIWREGISCMCAEAKMASPTLKLSPPNSKQNLKSKGRGREYAVEAVQKRLAAQYGWDDDN